MRRRRQAGFCCVALLPFLVLIAMVISSKDVPIRKDVTVLLQQFAWVNGKAQCCGHRSGMTFSKNISVHTAYIQDEGNLLSVDLYEFVHGDSHRRSTSRCRSWENSEVSREFVGGVRRPLEVLSHNQNWWPANISSNRSYALQSRGLSVIIQNSGDNAFRQKSPVEYMQRIEFYSDIGAQLPFSSVFTSSEGKKSEESKETGENSDADIRNYINVVHRRLMLLPEFALFGFLLIFVGSTDCYCGRHSGVLLAVSGIALLVGGLILLNLSYFSWTLGWLI